MDASCQWKASGGQFAGSSAVQFVGDEVVAASGTALRLHSVKTGELVAQILAHEQAITAIVMHRGDCFTASLDGSIRQWDLKTRSSLNTFHIGASIRRLLVCDAFFYAVTKDKKDTNQIIRFDRQKQQSQSLAQLKKPVVGFALKDDNKTLAATSGRSLLVWLPNGALLKRKHTHAMTALTFHPFEDYLCTGDLTGRIVLWYGYQLKEGAEPKKCVKSVLHWHAHAFQALQFTEDGTYLLSGGQEQVLVQWQMHDGHRQFLPRLGGRIASISVSPRGDMYAVVCDDNSIRIVSAISSRLVTTINGVLVPSNPVRTRSGKAPQMKAQAAYSIAADRLNVGRGHILLSVSRSTRLQFFDTTSNRSLAVLETDPSSVNRGCLSEIGAWAQSFDGTWLAVALRSQQALQANALSFYQWDNFKHTYVARIRVEDHCRTHSVVFHPTRDLCLALGPGEFRLWAPTDSKVRKASTTWAVQNSGRFRNLTPTAAAFSLDGTLVAIVFQDKVVTLWDVRTTELVHTIFDIPSVKQLAFCHRHLICVSDDRVYSWDCIDTHLIWSHPVPAIASLSSSKSFAVIASSQGTVTIFRPDDRSPVLSKDLPKACSVVFSDDSTLVAATSSGSLYTLKFL